MYQIHLYPILDSASNPVWISNIPCSMKIWHKTQKLAANFKFTMDWLFMYMNTYGTEAEIQLPLKRFPDSSVFPNPNWLV